MNTHSIEVVLFDLGGVMIQFQQTGYFAKMLGEEDDVAAMEKWLLCPAVLDYEKGKIDRDQFARGLIVHFDLPSQPSELLEQFLEWPQDLFPGSEELVSGIISDVRVGCLSNTSEFHWNHQKSSALLKDMFALKFLSFELGQLKPDPGIYLEVVHQLDCAPTSILFFDDNPANVAGAKTVGFDAHLTQGTSEAHQTVRQRGLLK